MRRIASLLTVAVLLMAVGLAQPASAGWRQKQCRFQSVEKGWWTPREVHMTEHCAIDHFPVSHTTADYVAERESHWHWYARNPYSGACGIYQHIPSYWPERLHNFNVRHPYWNLRNDDPKHGHGCYNGRSNVVVSIWMAYKHGWSPWGM